MNIVPFRDEHVQSFYLFIEMCWNDTYSGIIAQDFIDRFLKEAYNEERLYLRMNLPFYLMVEEEKIVGMANYSKVNANGELHLLALYVHPQYKGQGIGTALLNYGINELHPKCMFLDVEKENVQAIQFYLNREFKQVKEYKEEMFGYTLETILMRKDVEL